MDSLSKYELKALMKQNKGPCVSIFMPTPRARTLSNPIKFKNLLRETKEDLLETGIRTTTAKELLEPAQKLLRNGTFWRDQSNGLAVFLSPEASGHYRLPLDFEELVVVTKRFHIKPLLPLFSSDGRFYVLTLSQNEVRLLQCTRYRVNELELEGIPENAAIFHKHGAGAEDAKNNILQYFHQIDKGLHKLLRNKRAPYCRVSWADSIIVCRRWRSMLGRL